MASPTNPLAPKGTRLGVLIGIFALSASFLLTPLLGLLVDLGMRMRVGSRSDVGALQTWADQILEQPDEKLPKAPIHLQASRITLDGEMLPEFVRRVPAGGEYDSPIYIVKTGDG